MVDANPFDQGHYNTAELKHMGFQSVGQEVKISKRCTIVGLQNIRIGNNVRIDDGASLIVATGSLTLGSHIHIGAGSHITCAGGVTMADFSTLSQGVRIYSVSDDYSGAALTNPTVPLPYSNPTIAPVYLDRHVIIGSGSVVLPGVHIGEGSAVGALSLVIKSLEPWGIYAGAPVRRIKERMKDLLRHEQDYLASRSREL